MENSNSREYLEKITAAVIDNLRNTAPVPSVQMQDVPRKPFGGMTDEDEAELDDFDEDENPDVRMTEHRWDKHVENPAEFDASDDDDMARANGATRPQNGKKRSFHDYHDSVSRGDKGEDETNGGQESRNDEPSDDGNEVNDDTIDDLVAVDSKDEEGRQPSQEPPRSEKGAGVDGDGDEAMIDPDVPNEDSDRIIKIKKEQAEERTEPWAGLQPPSESKTNETSVASPATKDAETPAEPRPADESAPEVSNDNIADTVLATDPTDAMEVDKIKDKEAPTEVAVEKSTG